MLKETLTDQESNFISVTWGGVLTATHQAEPLSSPDRQTFNQTLKTMLKKTAKEEGKNGNKLLPYLLFTYWEVSPGIYRFLPLELLCRRDQLDVL